MLRIKGNRFVKNDMFKKWQVFFKGNDFPEKTIYKYVSCFSNTVLYV